MAVFILFVGRDFPNAIAKPLIFTSDVDHFNLASVDRNNDAISYSESDLRKSILVFLKNGYNVTKNGKRSFEFKKGNSIINVVSGPYLLFYQFGETKINGTYSLVDIVDKKIAKKDLAVVLRSFERPNAYINTAAGVNLNYNIKFRINIIPMSTTFITIYSKPTISKIEDKIVSYGFIKLPNLSSHKIESRFVSKDGHIKIDIKKIPVHNVKKYYQTNKYEYLFYCDKESNNPRRV